MNPITSSKTKSSNLVSFNLSSPSHPQYITVKNVWVREELDIPTPNVWERTFKYSHLK